VGRVGPFGGSGKRDELERDTTRRELVEARERGRGRSLKIRTSQREIVVEMASGQMMMIDNKPNERNGVREIDEVMRRMRIGWRSRAKGEEGQGETAGGKRHAVSGTSRPPRASG
jgi:hypothetical protein